ncbi:MAG: M23 family metallopeptidase [Chloroflexi bacterium]|nr:M23 family metallopeptidase [Chloroflexota bacterium]
MAAGLAATALLLAQRASGGRGSFQNLPTPIPVSGDGGAQIDVPAPAEVHGYAAIQRQAAPNTTRTGTDRYQAVAYTVEYGDSLFSIAQTFRIQPESLLWANEEVLGGRPDLLEPGMHLNVPPTDGVYYRWREGDTLEAVAEKFSAEAAAIIDWPGNPIADLTNPSIPPGVWVMIPGGIGEFQQWVFPDIASAGQGVSNELLGAGACSGDFPAGNGSGIFVWPSPIHSVVGNDYWDGHRALDIASGEGIGVYAADNGVVLFSGWATGGYGYMVYIDHGNGYSTLYAHLSQVSAQCGQLAAKGQVIGTGGSTGNSSGPHLHFEVRFQGGFLNPWQVLPPP